MYLHCRNTGGDFWQLVEKNRARFPGGVVHSFTGGKDELERALSLDLYVGLNGCSLKSEENLEIAKLVPLDRLMIETDSPYCEIRNTHASMKFVKTKNNAVKPEKWKQVEFSRQLFKIYIGVHDKGQE
jgi:TatD DNase family protein